MDMTPLNIQLPDSLRSFVDEQAASGGFGDAADYVRTLLQAEQRRLAIEQLEQQILAGLDSGPPIEATPAYWENVRQEVTSRYASMNS